MVGRAVSLIGGFRTPWRSRANGPGQAERRGGKGNPTTTNPASGAGGGGAAVRAGQRQRCTWATCRPSSGAPPQRIWSMTGIAAAARRAGAETVSFEDHGWVGWRRRRYLREVDVTEWFFKVDRVINLPVIKTHRYAGYSICLKNFVGATHFSQRPYLVDSNHWEEVVAELNLAFRPDLNIVDGTRTNGGGRSVAGNRRAWRPT
jgi:uncharacterized protein (DUF362 family)